MKTIAIDFDGVLHSYDGWNGDIPTGKPIDGAMTACRELAKEFNLVVFTTRNMENVRSWLTIHGFDMFEKITNTKRQWHVLIDDRCLTFTGDWSRTFKQIIAFTPYWRTQ